MASAVAESRPPESNTTAGAPLIQLLSGHIAPQILVQLDLEPHRQPILQNPIRELAGGQLLVTRGEQHRAARIQSELTQLLPTPLVVAAAADDELHEILGAQLRELVIAIAVLFPRARGFHVHDSHYTRVDARQGHRAAGFERD